MTGARTSQRFDLRKVGEGGVRAIMDGLRLDREHVLGIQLDETTGELLVEMTGPKACEHVESFVASMARTHRLVARKILMENHARELKIRDIDAALAQSEDLQLLGEGLTGLRGQMLALFRFFEREFAEMARDFDAEENYYPVMVPGEVLAEVGYFDHFPQHVTFCSHLADSLPLLESVAADARSGRHGLMESLGGRLDRPRHVLTPGVCLPCYRQQRDVVLGLGEVRALTMQNHVFRYEGASFRPLTRGWDFTVRDIVFFGSGSQLEGLRRKVMERTMALCRELDLEVSIELAHDPFFLDASRDKAVYQRMGEVKYELLFPMPHRREMLAAASFNLHRDFYTSIYDTRLTDGGLAESACTGFGLERWLYGFLSQKGFDHRGWPRRVAERLQAPC